MSITEKMRKVFDACTVMAGVEPDFECVYMTKGVALLYLDEIDAENAKLRNERREYQATIDSLVDECADHKTENAKLRELVRVFYHCTTSGKCDYCPINGGGTVHLMPDTICDTLHDRMRELGVEVEG